MDQRAEDGLSPYLTLSRSEWAALRDDTPMTLTPDEVTRLRSLHDRLDMKEVEDIYLPLSRLLSLYVAATQRLFIVQQHFLGTAEAKVPYIIGVAGSVAVGKSTTARVLQALLARWPNTPKVDLVTTDGFLLPNAVLESEGLMEKKGFPESYDLPTLAALSRRREGGAPAGARADLFASGLRRDAEPVGRGRSSRHPDRRGAERVCRPAIRRRTARKSLTCRTSSTSRCSSTPRRTCCTNGTSTAS